MKFLSILTVSAAFAQYNNPLTCTTIGRCDYQCSRPLGLALLGESCTGNSADLACCTETEACDLVNAGTITCIGLPYLDNTGAPRTYVCCGGPDNSGADSNSDSGTDNTNDDTLAGNSTEATDVSTTMDNHESSSGQMNISFFALLLAKLL